MRRRADRSATRAPPPRRTASRGAAPGTGRAAGRRVRHVVGVGDPRVVDVRPALGDRPPRLGQRARPAGRSPAVRPPSAARRRTWCSPASASAARSVGSSTAPSSPRPNSAALAATPRPRRRRRAPGRSRRRPALAAPPGPAGVRGRPPPAPRSRPRSGTVNTRRNAADVASSTLTSTGRRRTGWSARDRARPRRPRSCRTCCPSASVISGVASSVHRLARSTRRIRSVPAVRLPHWSLPPVCSVQPYSPEQLQVVHALQDLVAELGVADALVAVRAGRRPRPCRSSCSPGSACRRRAGTRARSSARSSRGC